MLDASSRICCWHPSKQLCWNGRVMVPKTKKLSVPRLLSIEWINWTTQLIVLDSQQIWDLNQSPQPSVSWLCGFRFWFLFHPRSTTPSVRRTQRLRRSFEVATCRVVSKAKPRTSRMGCRCRLWFWPWFAGSLALLFERICVKCLFIFCWIEIMMKSCIVGQDPTAILWFIGLSKI